MKQSSSTFTNSINAINKSKIIYGTTTITITTLKVHLTTTTKTRTQQEVIIRHPTLVVWSMRKNTMATNSHKCSYWKVIKCHRQLQQQHHLPASLPVNQLMGQYHPMVVIAIYHLTNNNIITTIITKSEWILLFFHQEVILVTKTKRVADVLRSPIDRHHHHIHHQPLN